MAAPAARLTSRRVRLCDLCPGEGTEARAVPHPEESGVFSLVLCEECARMLG